MREHASVQPARLVGIAARMDRISHETLQNNYYWGCRGSGSNPVETARSTIRPPLNHETPQEESGSMTGDSWAIRHGNLGFVSASFETAKNIPSLRSTALSGGPSRTRLESNDNSSSVSGW